MPYRSTKDLSPETKEIIPSERGRQVFIDAYNAAHRRGLSEPSCFAEAWSVLERRGYRKNSKGQWVR